MKAPVQVGQQVTGARAGRDLYQFQHVGGNVTVHSGPVARSAYLEQVRQIAPLQLHDRDTELAELVAFCTEPDRGQYAWWRASAWTGKSALMSWFVLHPPPGTQVVSFFVTARYAGQNDRVAFAEVVLEQVAELLGQSMPTFLTEATREAHLLGMLAEAAYACQQQGQRLVLVVDGLDEDRGVTTGPDAYSIAALLPSRPVPGLQIIVSGRPDPPVPTDVPDDHPLRDPAIVKVLGRSRWADVVKADMQRELKRLLHGTRTEQDLLGLVTAAGGGLRAVDLGELTGLSVIEIEEHLQTVAGRSFTTRAGRWQPGIVYVMGHEELQVAATHFLGDSRLINYREQLHSWAEGYRHNLWPAGTPEYLLRGYYRMLRATGDIPRIVALATDPARHDRMLDVTGGDTSALAEVIDAQDAVLALDEPDLLSMTRLAVRRASIVERNANLPASLPTVWAIIGNPNRAEALARAFSEPSRQAQALTELVKPIAAGGDVSRALNLAQQAEMVIQTIVNEPLRIQAVKRLAEALATAGDFEKAWELASAVTTDSERIETIGALARALAATGDFSVAEAAIGAITTPDERIEAVKAIVAAYAPRDLSQAKAFAEMIPNPVERTAALFALTTAIAEAGNLEQAEQVARAITAQGDRAAALTALVREITATGDLDWAEDLVRAIDPGMRAHALVILVTAIAGTGDFGRAETAAWAIADPERRNQALIMLAKMAAADSDLEQAETAARAITDPGRRNETLRSLAAIAAAYGDIQRATRINRSIPDNRLSSLLLNELAHPAYYGIGFPPYPMLLLDTARATSARGAAAAGLFTRAEGLARAISNPFQRADSFTSLASAAAAKGNLDQARALTQSAMEAAETIADPYQQAKALIALVQAAVNAASVSQVQLIVPRASRAAHSIGSADLRTEVLMALAEKVAVADDLSLADEMVCVISDPTDQAAALTVLATKAAIVGNLESAQALAHQAETVGRAITTPERQTQTMIALAKAATIADELEEAQALALRAARTSRVIPDRNRRADSLIALAEVGAIIGNSELVDRAETAVCALASPVRRAKELTALATMIGAVGDLDRAEAITENITKPHLRAQALTALAGTALAAGDLAKSRALARQAERFAHSIKTADRQATALTSLLDIMARNGDREHLLAIARRADEVAGGMQDPYRRAAAQTALIVPIAMGGDRKWSGTVARKAERSAQAVTDSEQRALALSSLADSLAEAGDYTVAVNIARSIASPHIRASALAALAIVGATAGHDPQSATLIQDAEEAARAITDPDQRVEALIALAETTAATGDHPRSGTLIRTAEQTAHTMVDPRQRVNALVAILQTSAALDDLVWTQIATALSLASPDLRAETLVTLAGQAPTDRAAPLIAQALAIADWIDLLEPLARIQPSAVTAVVSEYLAGFGGLP